MRTPFTAESMLSMKDRLSSNIGRVVLGETPGGFSGSGAGRLLGITFVERFQPLPDY